MTPTPSDSTLPDDEPTHFDFIRGNWKLLAALLVNKFCREPVSISKEEIEEFLFSIAPGVPNPPHMGVVEMPDGSLKLSLVRDRLEQQKMSLAEQMRASDPRNN